MKVTVVKSDGDAVVVEVVVSGILIRKIVPSGTVVAGELDEDVFEKGIEYGLPFDEIITAGDIIPVLTRSLHNAGIWTLEDMKTKGQIVVSALQAAYRIDLGRLVQAAEKYEMNKSVSKPKGKTKKESEA